MSYDGCMTVYITSDTKSIRPAIGIKAFRCSCLPMTEWKTWGTAVFCWGCHAHDCLQSKWSAKDVCNIGNDMGWMSLLKIWNIVDDLHKKLVSWLCHNYKAILLPSFWYQQYGPEGQAVHWKEDGWCLLHVGILSIQNGTTSVYVGDIPPSTNFGNCMTVIHINLELLTILQVVSWYLSFLFLYIFNRVYSK